MDRAAGGGDRADGVEDGGAQRDGGCGRADHPGGDRSGDERGGGGGARRGGRLSVDHQGGGGRRRQGDGARRGARRGGAGVRVGAPAGVEVLRRRGGVRGALSREPEARGGAGAGRRPRQRAVPGGARLHDPAAPPEADRGDALAGGGRAVAGADRRDRGERGAGGGLSQRGHDRGPADRGGRLLLHGDEHAHPGGAHGHRDGDRPRPRQGADPGRAGRAALPAPGGRDPARARDRVPHQRRGRRQGVPARAGADHRLPGAGRARGARRFRHPGRRRDLRPLRPHDRQADRLRHRRARRPGGGCCARWRSSRSRGRRP